MRSQTPRAASRRIPVAEIRSVNRPFLRWPPSRYAIYRIAVSKLIRNRPALNKRPQPGSYLNIGCGVVMPSGFFNVDDHWRPGIDLCWDLEGPRLPFAADSVGGIFTEHCMEHISFPSFLRVAGEFRRILMPGRTVRIIVPDGGLYVRRYVESDAVMPYREFDDPPIPYTKFWSINRIFYHPTHRCMYDWDLMRVVLEHAGFQTVELCEFGRGRDSRLLVDQINRQPESLYVEATKR